MVAQVQAESLHKAYGPEACPHLRASNVWPGPETEGGSCGHLEGSSPAQSSQPPASLPVQDAEVQPAFLAGEAGLDAAEMETSGPDVALDIPAILAAPGYRIARITAGLSFPSRVDLLESQMRAGAEELLGECGEQLTPVYPQVVPGVAAFVASPTWFPEAK